MTVDKFPAVIQQIDEQLEAILTPAEMKFFREHIPEGAPGFMQYIKSARIRKTMRAVFEDYLDFLKTGN